MRYLKTAKVFVGHVDHRRAAFEIIKGFHDYFPYAQEFWLDHLSAAAETANDETPEREIEAMCEALATLFLKEQQQDLSLCNNPEQSPSFDSGVIASDEDVSHLHPKLISLARPLRGLLNYRYTESQTQRKYEPFGKKIIVSSNRRK